MNGATRTHVRTTGRAGATHRATRADVSDEEYAVTIDVLRRIVGNLGGDARLP